ncbi:uncharacterized protein [Haliotis asinina]|uniref:uncharacterized protein n=1 Tax=Haliotis asinina TaxID=109174 RepID=UPI003532230C
MKKLSFDVIYQLRLSFWRKTQTKQSCFINSHLRAIFRYQEERLSDVFFTLEGHEVCSVCWCTVFKISKTRFFHHGRAVKDCLPPKVDQRCDQNYDSQTYLEAKVWLDQYFKRHGDHMPHKTEVQLPSCLTKRQVFDTYVEDTIDQDKPRIGYSRFKELWREFFSYVKILKAKDFTQCTLCILYRDALQRKNLGKGEVTTLKEAKQGHLALQRLLREKYYKHGDKAKRSPSKYVSLIIDNMDQNKTNLPVFPEQSKLNQGHLPETLYLQADNWPKDNKNKTLLYFLALLVKLKIFKKVKLSFLMVGHTHEDVDQLFSVFARELRQRRAATCEALLQVLASSSNPKPTATALDGVWDMRQLFSNCDSPKGHKEAHVFVFRMEGPSVSMLYKDWPLKSEMYRKVILDFQVDLSTLTPVTLNKDRVDDTCKTMERDLPKWVSSARLSEEEGLWWASYIRKMGDIHTPAIKLSHFKPFMPAPREENTLPRNVQEALERSNEKMQKLSKVSLTKHRRQASAQL